VVCWLFTAQMSFLPTLKQFFFSQSGFGVWATLGTVSASCALLTLLLLRHGMRLCFHSLLGGLFSFFFILLFPTPAWHEPLAVLIFGE